MHRWHRSSNFSLTPRMLRSCRDEALPAVCNKAGIDALDENPIRFVVG
jgi:hypothetical protein